MDYSYSDISILSWKVVKIEQKIEWFRNKKFFLKQRALDLFSFTSLAVNIINSFWGILV